MTAPLTVDLMPPSMRRTRARRRRARAWRLILAVYGVALAAGAMALGAAAPPRSIERTLSLARLDATLGDLEQEERELRAEIDAYDQALGVVAMVAEHPDWSIAMAVVADAAGAQVVLTRLALAPMRVDAPREIAITGFATTNGEVNGFVSRLEACGLFHDVALEESRREPRAATAGFAFRIDATIGGGGH